MIINRLLFVVLVLLFDLSVVNAQQVIIRDPVISKMVGDVSAANLENLVRKLVSFNTRHTLSDTLSKKTGIGAARTWIKSEFERYGEMGEAVYRFLTMHLPRKQMGRE
ncbi:hypothetical protein [Pedobacter steynii]